MKERLSRPPPSQPPPSGDSGTTGGLAKSRSWQGFSAAHRTSRQQAFWEAERYESTSEKDLSLPPPPEKVPEAVNKRLHSSKSPNRYLLQGRNHGKFLAATSAMVGRICPPWLG